MKKEELFEAMCNLTEREKTNLLAVIFGYVNGLSDKNITIDSDDILKIIETIVKGEDIVVSIPGALNA